jgi:hypothetical protein
MSVRVRALNIGYVNISRGLSQQDVEANRGRDRATPLVEDSGQARINAFTVDYIALAAAEYFLCDELLQATAWRGPIDLKIAVCGRRHAWFDPGPKVVRAQDSRP